jgi:hypothetical protein
MALMSTATWRNSAVLLEVHMAGNLGLGVKWNQGGEKISHRDRLREGNMEHISLFSSTSDRGNAMSETRNEAAFEIIHSFI